MLSYKNTPETFDSVKDVDLNKRTVVAYWSAFDVEDAHGDIIERGAFERSIQERGPASNRPRIKVLYQHDWFQLIGKPTEIVEDDMGLRAEYKVAETTLGDDVLTLYQEGVLTEHSIGFNVVSEEQSGRVNVIKEIRLWEGSAVTWGANEFTPVVGIKALGDDGILKIEQQMKRAQDAIKRKDMKSDELCESLQHQIDQWHKTLQFVRQNRNESGFDVLRELAGLVKTINPPESDSGTVADPVEVDADIKALAESLRAINSLESLTQTLRG